MKSLIFFLLISSTVAAPSPSPSVNSALDTRIARALDPKLCGEKTADPLAPLRAEIENFRAEKKKPAAFAKSVSEWRADEERTKQPSPALGWIRALNPSALDEDFPARSAFLNCASDLRTFSDIRASGLPDPDGLAEAALQDWSNCLSLIYPARIPQEFAALKQCLIKSSTP